MKQEGSGGMSVKNEWPTAKINFAVVNQKSVVIFLCRAIFLAATVLHKIAYICLSIGCYQSWAGTFF
jgi:hypothetical protein